MRAAPITQPTTDELWPTVVAALGKRRRVILKQHGEALAIGYRAMAKDSCPIELLAAVAGHTCYVVDGWNKRIGGTAARSLRKLLVQACRDAHPEMRMHALPSSFWPDSSGSAESWSAFPFMLDRHYQRFRTFPTIVYPASTRQERLSCMTLSDVEWALRKTAGPSWSASSLARSRLTRFFNRAHRAGRLR